MIGCSAPQHNVCMPGAADGSPFQCPWEDSRVLGPVKPFPPNEYPTCGYIVWSGPGHDFQINPRPDQEDDYPCWTTPDRAVQKTFDSRSWRISHGGKP